MPDDYATRLENIPGTTKRLAWCPPTPLDEMNAFGRALNCSINDALPSCVTGAIGVGLNTLGDETAGLNINQSSSSTLAISTSSLSIASIGLAAAASWYSRVASFIIFSPSSMTMALAYSIMPIAD